MLFSGICVIAFIISAAVCLLKVNVYMFPLAFVINFVLLFVLWAVSCVICTRFVNTEKPCAKQSRLFRFYANCIINSLMTILRVKLHISGKEILPERNFLFVGNHRSSMDPIIEMGILRKYNMGFIAKKELFEIPVIGKIMHKNFCLSLNRGNSRDEVNTVIQAINIIKSDAASIGIYSEGTRNTGKDLLPFKAGSFKIAQKAECPIVIAVIRNSELIMKNAPFKRTDVYIEFIGVLDTEYLRNNNTQQISKKVQEIMSRHIKKY